MSDEPSKCTNYLRIVKLLVDVGTETVRSLFYHFKPRDKVKEFFESITICDELATLKRKNRLSREQFTKLVWADPNPDEFDLALLLTLLTNIFKLSIDGPENGWDKEVDEDDTSLGANLLRLKDIRNKMVGHKPNAELSSEEFENLWKQTETILIDITKFVDPTNKEEISAKIADYKTNALDETAERKYLSLLQTWHEEAVTLLSHLKNEVDMLCQKAEGFDIFFRSNIPERYLRYIMLLCEGGYMVLAGIMKRELEKCQTSLRDILIKNRSTLIEFNSFASSFIFTEDGKLVTDISFWGIKPLSYVILMLFHNNLTPIEQKTIAEMGAASNDYAKVAFEALNSDKFMTYWTDIVTNINVLANGLDSETQLECLDLIKKHNTGPVDETIAKQYLMQLRRNCEPFQSLVEQYIDLREKLKDAVEKMQKEGACFGKDQAIELKMMTFGKTEEKRELAENILYTIWQAAVKNTGGTTEFTTVKAEIEHILRGVRGIPGVKTVEVEKHCIILTVLCSSCESLLGLLDFFARPYLWSFMTRSSLELSSHCEETLVMTAFITAESMQTVLDRLEGEDDCGKRSDIRLRFGCSSIGAIENVRYLFQRNETSNYVNQMAQALSEELEEKISVSTALEVAGIPHVYSNPLISISESPWTQFVLPSDIGVPEQKPDFTHLQHLRSIIDAIEEPESNIADDLTDASFELHRSFSYIDEDEIWQSIISDFPGDEDLGLVRDRQGTSQEQGTADVFVTQQPTKHKNNSFGPAVDWKEYDIPKKRAKMSPPSVASSFGSFASLASNQSYNMTAPERRNTIG